MALHLPRPTDAVIAIRYQFASPSIFTFEVFHFVCTCFLSHFFFFRLFVVCSFFLVDFQKMPFKWNHFPYYMYIYWTKRFVKRFTTQDTRQQMWQELSYWTELKHIKQFTQCLREEKWSNAIGTKFPTLWRAFEK